MAMMTPQARSAAARKAAASRRANRVAGIVNPSARRGRRAPRGPVFAPKPDARALMLTSLAGLEDALVAKAAAEGKTFILSKGHDFERYQKIKALALGPASTPEAQTEAMSALRRSLIEAVKLVF